MKRRRPDNDAEMAMAIKGLREFNERGLAMIAYLNELAVSLQARVDSLDEFRRQTEAAASEGRRVN